jgi:hypothetical protein
MQYKFSSAFAGKLFTGGDKVSIYGGNRVLVLSKMLDVSALLRRVWTLCIYPFWCLGLKVRLILGEAIQGDASSGFVLTTATMNEREERKFARNSWMSLLLASVVKWSELS